MVVQPSGGTSHRKCGLWCRHGGGGDVVGDEETGLGAPLIPDRAATRSTTTRWPTDARPARRRLLLGAAALAVFALVVASAVGAIPGALPPLIGWAAATGSLGIEALILFGIQFVWQFPHFWAIAWVADEDYRRAGFKLLPSGGGRDLNTAFQIMIYTLLLLPLGVETRGKGLPE